MQETLRLRNRGRGSLPLPDQEPEAALADAYRQALRSVGDNQWLATDGAAAASLATLQDRWHQVNSEQPITASSAPRRRPVRLHRVSNAMPPAALDLLAKARVGLKEASALQSPNERYAAAHLAALRTAAAVLAARGRPDEVTNRRERIRSAWEVLPEVAPELSSWSDHFAAGAAIRARAEAGVTGAAGEREADDLIRDAGMFLRLVERMVPQLPAPDLFELTENQDTGAAVRQLSHGFDELFKSLGPPPPGLRQLTPVPDGGGGTER
ncbi:hypothetical protein GCM10010298_17180 [Streptomyces microflavus]|nr:hypothetical protein GCM10010298_17180 [Streptomyces microflavus]